MNHATDSRTVALPSPDRTGPGVLVLFSILILLFIAAIPAGATTIVLPTDAQLIEKSPLIVTATVVSTRPVDRNSAIWTESVLAVERTLKGEAPDTLTVREPGGRLGSEVTLIFGSPSYEPGERVLVFLSPAGDGTYRTRDMAVGKFVESVAPDGERFWWRDQLDEVRLLDRDLRPIEGGMPARRAGGFESFIRDRAAGRGGDTSYERDAKTLPSADGGHVSSNSAAAFTLLSEPQVFRWFRFERGQTADWYHIGTQPGYSGGGLSEIAPAMAAWNGYGEANIRYRHAGASTSGPGGLNRANGVNEILFNDPLGEVDGSYSRSSGGVVGVGGINRAMAAGSWTSPFHADSTHPQKTYTSGLYEVHEANLVIQDGVTPSNGISSEVLAEILAHEFGHTLGFGHSNDSGALMYYSVTRLGASLKSSDQIGARWLYPGSGGGGATPPPPPPAPAVPAAPSDLVASVAGSTAADLTWRDNAADETAQTIYVAVGSGSFSAIGNVGANATSTRVTGLNPGTWYRFYVTARNGSGESSASNIAGMTTPGGVSAAFSWSPSSPVAGQTVTFYDGSSGATSWQWSFGDGTTSTQRNPQKVFGSAGYYTVTLTASGNGSSSSATHAVQVTAPAPAQPQVTASFQMSTGSARVGEAVTMYDQSSGGPTSWYWNFGNGATSTQQNPTYAWGSPGVYNVSLTVSNGATSSTTSRSITISKVESFRAVVPVSAETAGANGTYWRTELAIFNHGTSGASVDATYISSAGGAPVRRSFTMNPGATAVWPYALRDLFGVGSGAGAIVIEATSASSVPQLKVTTRTFTNSSFGSYGQSVPAVAASNGVGTIYATGLATGGDFRTNVGLVNPTGSWADMTLTLYASNGAAVGQTRVGMGPNSFQQTALTALFGNVGSHVLRPLSLRVDTSNDGVIVYGSVVDNRTQDPVYVHAGPRPGVFDLMIGAVGRTAGANGTDWRSEVALFNPGPRTLAVTLKYLAAGADNRAAAGRTYNVAPNRTLLLEDVLAEFGVQSGTGALRIFWSGDVEGPVITSRTYTRRGDGGSFGQSIDMKPTALAKQRAVITGIRSDASYRTNVGFVNSGAEAIDAEVTVMSTWGTVIGRGYVTVAPESQLQLPLGTIVPAAANNGGAVSLVISASRPTLLAYGSVVDNLSGDPVYLPSE